MAMGHDNGLQHFQDRAFFGRRDIVCAINHHSLFTDLFTTVFRVSVLPAENTFRELQIVANWEEIIGF